MPKFEIGFDSQDEFMFDDKKASVVVRAKYTHGKPMKGTVVIEVNKRHYYYEPKEAIVKKTVPINGRATIEIDIKNELKFDVRSDSGFYDVKAKVTENLTGLSGSCEMTIKVFSTYVIRTNPGTDVKFKQDSTASLTVCSFIDYLFIDILKRILLNG